MSALFTTPVAVLMILACAGSVLADAAAMVVATANASYQFEINDGGSQLYYKPQPDTANAWYDADGNVVTYTTGGVAAVRDGMKTYAATDIAFGQPLGSLSMSFQYAYGFAAPDGYPYKGYPTINVAITDGNGNYAIWSATSGGTGFTTAPLSGREGWYELTLDMTSFADSSHFGKINESTDTTVLPNGNLNSTPTRWVDIKDWTVAGFYAEQYTPTGGFGNWCETLWDVISEPGSLTAPQNRYGISLVWGDTVGGMNGDGDGEVGLSAERAYGQGGKCIDHVIIGVNGADYALTFEAGVVPEPVSLVLLAAGAMALIRRRTA